MLSSVSKDDDDAFLRYPLMCKMRQLMPRSRLRRGNQARGGDEEASSNGVSWLVVIAVLR